MDNSIHHEEIKIDPEVQDIFEVVDAGQGDEFMAVKPWIGAIKEPTNHPDPNPDKPLVSYEIEYIYGYRCEDSRQNLFYNPDMNCVYMAAAVGIILNGGDNT